jgi:hypothetical protein
MKFEIHFEFRASLRKFQGLNFWDATRARWAAADRARAGASVVDGVGAGDGRGRGGRRQGWPVAWAAGGGRLQTDARETAATG